MSTTATVSPEVAEEMAAILGEVEIREVSYEETENTANQIRMTVPVPLTPKDSGTCEAGPCC